MNKTLGIRHLYYTELIIGLIFFLPLFYLIYAIEYGETSIFNTVITGIVYFTLVYAFYSTLRFLNLEYTVKVNSRHRKH